MVATRSPVATRSRATPAKAKAAAKATPAKATPAKASAKKTPAKAAAKATPAKATPAKATPAKAAVKKTPAKAVVKKTPAKAAAKATPAKATPAKATPAKATPAKATPAKATPAKAAVKKTPVKAAAKKAATPAKKVASAKKPAAKKAKTAPVPVVMSESEDESDYSDLEEDLKKQKMNTDDLIPLSQEKLDTLKPVAAAVKAEIEKIKPGEGPAKGRGVIYLGHIPYGFFEDQMKPFFDQFGEVSRLRLSRNKKTGRSRHYAFIEFKSPEVAMIVADTMNRYMMFERTLVCQYIAQDKVHPSMFKGAGKKFRVIPWQRIAKDQHNRVRTEKEQTKRVSNLLSRETKRRKQLEAAGIDYEFPGYGAKVAPKRKRKTFD